MSDDPNSAGSPREADYTPFKKRVQLFLNTISPGSGLLNGAEIVGRMNHWLHFNYDDRLDLLERDRATLQKENAELRGQLDLLTKADAEVADNMQTREDRSDVWASAKAWLSKSTDAEAFAERLAAVEDRLAANVGNTVAAHKRIDGAFRALDRQHDRIDYAEDTLQHHASLIAGLQRVTGVGATVAGPADEAAQPEFPDPVPAEELVLERGSIVRIREGTHTGLATLDHKRVWEVVGFFSPEGEPANVQLGLYPWSSESPRPMHWVRLDDIVGLAE